MLEQIVYQTNADPQASIIYWKESGADLTYFESQKGIVTFDMKNPRVKVQLTSTGRLIFFVDSKISEKSRKRLWQRLKRILRSASGDPVADNIKWISRRPYPGRAASQHEVRLKALMLDADGSLESQFSVIDELRAGKAVRKKRKTKTTSTRSRWPA